MSTRRLLFIVNLFNSILSGRGPPPPTPDPAPASDPDPDPAPDPAPASASASASDFALISASSYPNLIIPLGFFECKLNMYSVSKLISSIVFGIISIG